MCHAPSPPVFRFLSTVFAQAKDFVYLKVKQVAYTEVAATVRGAVGPWGVRQWYSGDDLLCEMW